MKPIKKPKTELTLSELYAVDRAARSARSREIARLVYAGADTLARFASHALSALDNRKEISHA